jgi:hypothetical protein
MTVLVSAIKITTKGEGFGSFVEIHHLSRSKVRQDLLNKKAQAERDSMVEEEVKRRLSQL